MTVEAPAVAATPVPAAATPAPPQPTAAASAALAPAPPAPSAPVSGVAVDGKAPPEPGKSLVSDAKPPEEKGAETKPEEKPAEAPIYEFKFPDGFKTNEEQVTQLKTLAAELKIPAESAQKLVDMHVAAVKEVQDASMKAWTDMQAEWRETVTNDKEIGGDKLGPTLAAISNVIDDVAKTKQEATEIRQAFDMTGAGNNPALIRFLARIAKGMTEGTTVAGSPERATPGRSAAQILYPNQGQPTQ